MRCPACGKKGVVESNVVLNGGTGTLSGSRVIDFVAGRGFRKKILAMLFAPLEKKLAREGMPLIWREYYCASCGGQFRGDAMFVSWFGDYWRQQNSKDRDKTING
jgi:DNA-directed RNA polymerase subunit RPC12/RpoP